MLLNNFIWLNYYKFIWLLLTSLIIVSGDNYFENYFNLSEKSIVDGNEVDDSSTTLLRNTIKLEQYKWPDGIVPFEFNGDYNNHEKQLILNAMNIFSNETCIKFIPKDKQHKEHIKFFKSSMCGSNVGYRPNRVQPLAVTYSLYCLNIPGAIQHELFHVLGFLHEQARYDRDDYITILWDNINPEYYQNFRKATEQEVDTFSLPYDYNSLMHYPGNAFAKSNGKLTIISNIDSKMKLGQLDGPTFYDLEKLRKMYNC